MSEEHKLNPEAKNELPDKINVTPGASRRSAVQIRAQK